MTDNDDTPCIPIPCPSFNNINMGELTQVAWEGLDFPVIKAGQEFLTRRFEQQVDDLWAMIIDQVAEMRQRNGYGDDIAIAVKLPDNPQLNDVFTAVKARARRWIIIQLASEEN